MTKYIQICRLRPDIISEYLETKEDFESWCQDRKNTAKLEELQKKVEEGEKAKIELASITNLENENTNP